jgi:hypothetical protein
MAGELSKDFNCLNGMRKEESTSKASNKVKTSKYSQQTLALASKSALVESRFWILSPFLS